MAMTISPTTVARVPEDWWESFEPPPGARAEVIRGVLSLTPSPNDAHGVVQSRLISRLTPVLPDGYVAVPGIEWRLAVGGMVAATPQPDVMVCRWDAKKAQLSKPPILAVEVLSPSDTSPWEGISRIQGKRLDYAANGLEHYLEVDPGKPSITRFELRDAKMVAVECAAGDEMLTATEPFPYKIQASALIEP